MAHSLISLAEETAAHGEGHINAYLVGGVSLLVLLALLMLVIAFGGGREHS